MFNLVLWAKGTFLLPIILTKYHRYTIMISGLVVHVFSSCSSVSLYYSLCYDAWCCLLAVIFIPRFSCSVFIGEKADLAIKRSVLHNRRPDCILPCTLELLDLPVLQASSIHSFLFRASIEACQYTHLISYTKTISSVKKKTYFNIQFIVFCIIAKL